MDAIERVIRYGRLEVRIFEGAGQLAAAAASQVADDIRQLLAGRSEINVIISGAESQQGFHRELAGIGDIDWGRINTFSVDEFSAPGIEARFAVAGQPARDLYSRVRPKSINVIDPCAVDPQSEADRYAGVLARHRPDLACLGIGVSGHIAFNEPGQTDFADPHSVRVIRVTETSKTQLLTDPNFLEMGQIPDFAITTTLSELMRCPKIYLLVPFRSKAEIVRRFFESDVNPELPATLLKDKEGTVLFLDKESASLTPSLAL